MKKIASFEINHDLLQKGLYVSRIDGDAITYDLRMKVPNKGDYLSPAGAHSIEHLMATFIRNSEYSDETIYVGPMGCRTGFYLIFRDSVSKEEVLEVVRDSLAYISEFSGEMPGSKRYECGNYLDHDVEEARAVAKDMLKVLENWKEEDFEYKKDDMKHTPFRYDYVGSFLRPAKLKAARTAYEQGKISHEELKEVEDEEITRLIQKVKSLGYHVITDGEFRRAWWHLDFFWGLNGIEKVITRDGLHFHGETTKAHSARIVGKITGENHPFIEHFRFVKQFEDENTVAKQTIPSPAQLLTQLRLPEFLEDNRKIYPDDNELKDDIVKAYHTVIKDLYEAGCRNLQLDDCTWTLYADRSFWPAFGITEEKLKVIAEEEVELNNRVIACKPFDMVINTHVCRGNFHSTYANSGPYDPIAPYLFAKENVDAFYLEYDDARSGSFEPLKYVPKGKKVVLGLITTKKPELENKQEIIDKIMDASRYVDIGDLYISTQCGFASTEEGNILLEKEQWKKLELIKEIAEEVWM